MDQLTEDRLLECDWCKRMQKWGVETDTGLVPNQMCCQSSEIVTCCVCRTHSRTTRPYTFHCEAVEGSREVERVTCPHCDLEEKMQDVMRDFDHAMNTLKIKEDRHTEEYEACLSHLFYSLKGYDWTQSGSYYTYLTVCMRNEVIRVREEIRKRQELLTPSLKTKEGKKERKDIRHVALRHRVTDQLDLNAIPDRAEVNTQEEMEAFLSQRRLACEFLHTLDEDVAKIVKLAHGMSRGKKAHQFKEIAKIMGVHKNTITRKYSAAYDQMREWGLANEHRLKEYQDEAV